MAADVARQADSFYGNNVRRNEAGEWTDPGEGFQALTDFQTKLVDSLEEDHSAVKAGQESWRWTIEQARDLSKEGPMDLDAGVVDVEERARPAMLLVQDLVEQHGRLRDLETAIAANNIDPRLTAGARVLVRFGHGAPRAGGPAAAKKKSRS